MNSLIDTLNLWGGRVHAFAWPMLWQSSVLILVLFAFDFALRRKVRAAVRYALWLVVLVKLAVPPSLALPTSLAWWVRPPAVQLRPELRTLAFSVSYGDFVPLNLPTPAPAVFVPPPKPPLSGAGRAAATWAVVGVGLLAWLILRWRKVAGDVREATATTSSLKPALDEAQHNLKVPGRVRLLVTKRAMSPAVCGLLRPVILLPQSLVERLNPTQLRAVLLHELVHLRRGDVWVNCAQALLQIFYWWHPLLWLANARIRRVREEAVDDAVMLALRDEADAYAPTLLEVAKLAFNRPLASLGLVGILESRSALRQRIERLVDFHPPRKAGLTIASALCVLAFATLAVPMERAPATRAAQGSAEEQIVSASHPRAEVSITNEEVKLRMIVLNKSAARDAVQTRTLAAEILAKVKGGAAFSEMASVFSEGRQGREGGDWGWVQKYDRDGAPVLRKELGDVAFSLKPGEVSGVIETPDVIYLMLVGDKRPVHAKSLSAQDDSDRKIEETKHATASSPTSRATTNFMSDFELSGAKPESAIQYDYTTGISTARNGGLVRYRGLTITADSIAVNAKAKTITADGHVRFARDANPDAHWLADRIQLSTDNGTVIVKSSNVRNAGGAFAPEVTMKFYEDLVTRTFKLEPNVLYAGLERATGLKLGVQDSGIPPIRVETTNQTSGFRFITRTNAMQQVSVAVATFFSSLGVDLASPEALALGKSVFWGDRKGVLLVRATKQDLDVIETAIEVLNRVPPQINIQTRFVEIGQDDAKSLGFDWHVGNIVLANRAPTNSASKASSQLYGVLTDPQFRVVLRALEQRNGVDILTGPEVTTVSGRQAQIQVVDIQTVVTGTNPQAQLPLGIVSTNGLTNSLYQTQAMPFGPVLDVIPYLAADGNTINMTVIPTVTEFLGYDDPSIYGLTNSTGQLDKTVLPLPHFRVRQMTVTASVRDGQTLVLIGTVTTEVLKKPDGSTETKDVSSTQKKQLIVFITPTLVDPAGNRLHTDDESPPGPK